MPDQRIDLTISVATWNNRDLIADCLRSILENPGGLALEIIVVDNASSDGTAEMIPSDFPNVRLIENEEPLGFSANHNQAIRESSGRYILILNDDTRVIGDALIRAVHFLDANPDAGAAGCTLVKPDGASERISQRFPHPLDPLFPWLRDKVGDEEPTPTAYESGQPVPCAGTSDILPPPGEQQESQSRERAIDVDRLSGACLMVRREVVEQVGLLDERFDPAFGEDTDWCWRIKHAGWRIVRLVDARVVHLRGHTARREFGTDHARRMQEAKFRWYRKHRPAPVRWLYRGSVLMASMIQLALIPLSAIRPSQSAAARARARRLIVRIHASLSRVR